MELLEIFMLILAIFGILSQIPILVFAKQKKGKYSYKETLLTVQYPIIIHIIVISMLLANEPVFFLELWSLIGAVLVLYIGRNYINTKELTNVELELGNRLWIALPTGMAIYVLFFEITSKVSVMLQLIIPLTILIGVITIISNKKRLKSIREESDAIFWKKIHNSNILLIFLFMFVTIFAAFLESMITMQHLMFSIFAFVDIFTFLSFSIKKKSGAVNQIV